MRRFLPLAIFVLLIALSLACRAAERLVFDDTPTPTPRPTHIPTHTLVPTSTPTAAPTPTPNNCPNGECIVSCVNRLDAIVHPKNKKTLRRSFDDEYTLITYQVDGDQISHPKLGKVPASLKSYQDDRASQAEIWNYFVAIIPLNQRHFLTHYLVFTDGQNNSLAGVAQSEDSANQWDLSVDILDTGDPKDLTFTLVHEFGHLLTLNPDQVTPSQAIFDHPNSDSVYEKEERACPNYFPGEGCSHKDSYINLFVGRFWDKIYDEWLDIDSIENDDLYENRLDRFYQKYKDQFVTNYAPTSPEEDIAETWAFFILKPKPGNHTIANQKVLFLYDFPELVALREQIARNLCDQLEK